MLAHPERTWTLDEPAGGVGAPHQTVTAEVRRLEQADLVNTRSVGAVQAPGTFSDGMLAYMQRTTVKLPDELDARLRHEAQRRGVTVSELTRQAIESLLEAPRGRRRLLAAGAGASGHHDISERIEEIVANEVAPSH